MRGVRGRRIAKPAVIDISEREQMDEELEREGEREYGVAVSNHTQEHIRDRRGEILYYTHTHTFLYTYIYIRLSDKIYIYIYNIEMCM